MHHFGCKTEPNTVEKAEETQMKSNKKRSHQRRGFQFSTNNWE